MATLVVNTYKFSGKHYDEFEFEDPFGHDNYVDNDTITAYIGVNANVSGFNYTYVYTYNNASCINHRLVTR